jgi:hypothetical protein
VIKGDVSSPMEFPYFRFSPESDLDLGVPRYIPIVGNRRIYFLKPSNNGYRSVGDVTDYTLTIGSGHPNPGFFVKARVLAAVSRSCSLFHSQTLTATRSPEASSEANMWPSRSARGLRHLIWFAC